MSEKAVQNSNNNGGAQSNTHVSSIPLTTNLKESENNIKSIISTEKLIACNRVGIQLQDGACLPHLLESSESTGNVNSPTLANPTLLHTGDITSTLANDANNVRNEEWITTSVEGLGQFFGIADSQPALESGEVCVTFGSVGDIFDTAPTDSQTTKSSAVTSHLINSDADSIDNSHQVVSSAMTIASMPIVQGQQLPISYDIENNPHVLSHVSETSVSANVCKSELYSNISADTLNFSNATESDSNPIINVSLTRRLKPKSASTSLTKSTPRTFATVVNNKHPNIIVDQRAQLGEVDVKPIILFPDRGVDNNLSEPSLFSADDSSTEMLDLPAETGAISEGFTFTLKESHIVLQRDSEKNKITCSDENEGESNNLTDEVTLTVQERACLEEIERGSQLTDEERELIAEKHRELNAIQDFTGLNEQSIICQSANAPSNIQEHYQILSPKAKLLTNTVSQKISLDDETQPASIKLPANMLPKTYVQETSSGDTTFLLHLNDDNENRDEITICAEQTDYTTADMQRGTANQEIQQVLQIAKPPSSNPSLPDNTQLVALPNGNLLLLTSQPSADNILGGQQPKIIPYQPNQRSNKDSSNPDVRESLTELPCLSPNATSDDGVVKIFECTFEGCGQRFSKPSRLKIHSMSHTGERPYICSEAGCEWAFKTAYKLKRHQECHGKKKDFVCSFPGCGRQFTTIYNLKTHYRLHQRPNSLTCSHHDCDDRFATQKQLDLHLKSHSNAKKTYKCPHEGCDMMFFSPYCMGSHARVHQRQREFICEFEGCNKVFDKQCRLNQHTRCHSGERPYVCPVEECNWAFTSSSKLRRHLQKHTGERQWVCPISDCGKRFMRSEHLKGHIITHTGEKPFLCEYEGCGMRFSARSSLYVHTKKHREPAKGVIYFCPLEGCNSRYKSKTQLRTHIEKHYKKQLPTVASTGTAEVDVDTVPSVEDETVTAPLFLIDESTAKMVSAGGDNVNTQTQPATVTINMVDSVGPSGERAKSLPYALLPVSFDFSQGVQGLAPGGLVITSGEALETSTRMDTTESEVPSSPTAEKDGAGSARTDWKSNQMLSSRAKRRRQHVKENALLSWEVATLSNGQDAAEWCGVNSNEPHLAPGDPESATFSLSDVMTSQGITFRDPETGAIYVQTQLLQDDPPVLEGYGDEDGCISMDTSLETEFNSMLQDAQRRDEVDNSPTGDFSNTTINLQDLA